MRNTARQWIAHFRYSLSLAPIALFAFWLLCCCWLWSCAPSEAWAQAKPVYQFRSGRGVGDTDRVVGLLEAGGEVKEAGDERPR